MIDNDNQLIAFAPAGLTSYKIPDGVTTIGQAAFNGFKNLTWVTIPNSVETIEENAFANCSGLTSITIPNSVTLIKSSVFHTCTGLTSVVIGNQVATIGESAFAYCNNLAEIISLRMTAPSAKQYAFKKVPTTCKVIVPNATAEDSYKSADYWSTFSSTITDHHTVSTFGENMATLWLSYPVKIPSGIEAYTAELSDDKKKVKLTQIADTIIPAKTGVILKKTGNYSSYDFVIAPTSYDVTTSNENQLIGYPADVTLKGSETDYYFKLTYKTSVDTDFGFYRTQSTETLKANKAYLKLDKSIIGVASAPSRGIGIEWGDEGTTEIESVVDFDIDNSTMYNLQGMPVGNDYKGIVIKNGRKMLNK